MKTKLSINDIKYNFNFSLEDNQEKMRIIPEYSKVYRTVDNSMQCSNLSSIYIIDDYSKEKLDNLILYIKEKMQCKNAPSDICYVTLDDIKSPKGIILKNGAGVVLKEELLKLQDHIYTIANDFYNNNKYKEKEEILEEIQKVRSKKVSILMKTAEDRGFEIKTTLQGFSFTPLNEEGKCMSEKEFDLLLEEKKDEILKGVSNLKVEAQAILKDIKEYENQMLIKLKDLYREYLLINCEEILNYHKELFMQEEKAYLYINKVFNNIVEDLTNVYSMNQEDDEEEINDAIYKYKVNILIDNSKEEHPRVIFEEDPSVSNLIGSIEYENHNGVYTTDVEMIAGGTILKSNEGCLIIRLNTLMQNPNAYYYLKKALITKKLDFDYSRGYLELLSLEGLKPEPIDVNLMVIVIGDFYSYDVLYNYDEDFKKIFKLRAEYEAIMDINTKTSLALYNKVTAICNKYGIYKVADSTIYEIAKHLSRKAESREEIFLDDDEIDRILTITCNDVLRNKEEELNGQYIKNEVYNMDDYQRRSLKYYKDGKMLIELNGKKVGQINGLSVIDTGYLSFGKPMKITCSIIPGEGNINDCNKNCNLSGNIHSKSLNIIKGTINNILRRYTKLPVDINLCFEQLYGLIEGDSASLSETAAILSVLSNYPIKQNFAVTGSVNQLGEVQPIGGVNEKIEGYYEVCKCMNSLDDTGVIIPSRNKSDLVLKDEVMEAIDKGIFNVYTVDNVIDALKLLFDKEDLNYDNLREAINQELKKYTSSKKGKREKVRSKR